MNIALRDLLAAASLALAGASAAHAERLPRPDRVMVVIEENRDYSQVMNMCNSNSYIHALARRGMLFAQFYGITHPGQPNYLALFSGSTHGIANNACPNSFALDSLASRLLDAV